MVEREFTPPGAENWKAKNPRGVKEVPTGPIELSPMSSEEAAKLVANTEKLAHQARRAEQTRATRAAFEVYGSKGKDVKLRGRDVPFGRELKEEDLPEAEVIPPKEMTPEELEMEEITETETEENEAVPPPYITDEERKKPGKWLN